MPDTPDRDAIRRRLDLLNTEQAAIDATIRGGLDLTAEMLARHEESLREVQRHAPADIAALLAYTERLEKALGETAKLCRDAVEEIGIREAAHGYTPIDADYEAARNGCWFCIRVDVLDEAVRAIDAALARREGEA